MALAALLALSILAAGPVGGAPVSTVAVSGEQSDDYPPGAPTDDYGFVAWCYGALDESISVYGESLPELKAIDKRFGSPVHEAVPYADDIKAERQALKRFAAAMEAAERASPRPIAPIGVSDMNKGRSIWSNAKLQPKRQEAHAWLMWGLPNRCESTAKTLKARATLLGQAMAIGAPTVETPHASIAAHDEAAAPPPADATPAPLDHGVIEQAPINTAPAPTPPQAAEPAPAAQPAHEAVVAANPPPVTPETQAASDPSPVSADPQPPQAASIDTLLDSSTPTPKPPAKAKSKAKPAKPAPTKRAVSPED